MCTNVLPRHNWKTRNAAMKFCNTKVLSPVAEPLSVAVNTIGCSWNILNILHIRFNGNFSIIYEKREASFLNFSQAEVTILFANKWRSARAYWYLNWIVLRVCWSVSPHFCRDLVAGRSPSLIRPAGPLFGLLTDRRHTAAPPSD